MIEIKFRAWDYDNECMYDDSQVIIHNGTVFIGRIKYSQQISQDTELMQYTGLKDKNGVEIYEGDILRDYDNELIGVVSFQDGAFIVSWENEFCNTFEWSSESVIGNIYENPELLEQK